MKRKVVQTGSSLAITLPNEVVEEFGVKKGQEVDVTVHPTTGAVIVRLGPKYFEGGKVTKRFKEMSREVLKRYRPAFRELAK
jgi:antitoxin component of MazEF toxin-antitoxin module